MRRGGRRIRDLFHGGGIGKSAAEAALDALLPDYQYRADTVTLSGPNVQTIPNRKGADVLVTGATVAAAPVPDILFGGAKSISFTGDTYFQSNLPATDWKFMQAGAGAETFVVFAPTGFGPLVDVVVTTFAGNNGTNLNFNPSGQLNIQIDASPAILSQLSPAGVVALNTALYVDWAWKDGAPLESVLSTPLGAMNTVAVPLAPAAGDVGPLKIGASGGYGPHMRWCETLVFRRVLSEYERQIVREYIQDRYAIASPAIVGPDREILKLVPFCDFRAGAFTLAGANASAFLDKARIGHSFGAAVAQQVVAPTPSALFGGAPAAIFGGASSYTSNLVASSWNFLVRGTGATVFFAYAPQNPTQNSLLLASATGIAAGVTGFTLFSTPGVGTIQAFAIDAATAVSSIAGPPQVQGVGTLVSWRQRDAGTPRATLKVSGSAVSTNNILLAGPSSSSQVMTLGRSASDVMRAAWESLLVFDRELTSEEYAIVYNAILTRTGLVS